MGRLASGPAIAFGVAEELAAPKVLKPDGPHTQRPGLREDLVGVARVAEGAHGKEQHVAEPVRERR